MERITSKLIRVLAINLLCAVAVTTASSQEQPRVMDPAVVARGEALANEDPLAVELRDQQPNDYARRGFDIGMAIAEGQTLPGPGKDKICASLNSAESDGCRIGVLFSVDRNRNAKLAAVGAAIAQANPRVAAVRNGSRDVFFRLGFDIATGIFGDPAQGALGNTLTGPGSLGIRDALSRTGQRGFNASVGFHLGRTEERTPESRPRRPPTVASNEILCRGYSRPGGSEYVFFDKETITTFEIAYTPSLRAAGPKGEGLQPGECSWVDRLIGNNGPFRIKFTIPANTELTIPAYLKDESHYWSFFIPNTNQNSGYFEASSNRSWKPPISLGDSTQPADPYQRKRRVPLP